MKSISILYKSGPTLSETVFWQLQAGNFFRSVVHGAYVIALLHIPGLLVVTRQHTTHDASLADPVVFEILSCEQ